MEKAELIQRIEALRPWFHRIDFGGGVVAERDPVYGPDGTYPFLLWKRLEPLLPRDLHGMDVLDVGCNAGFFSVIMKQLGASRVVGIETTPQFLEQARLVREALHLDLELRGLDAYDLTPELGSFDLTLFLGVVYHLKHPLLGLERVAGVTKGLLVVESAILQTSTRPSTRKYGGPSHELVFIENGEGLEGLYNWFVPTMGCLKVFLKTVGFSRIVNEVEDGERAILVARRD